MPDDQTEAQKFAGTRPKENATVNFGASSFVGRPVDVASIAADLQERAVAADRMPEAAPLLALRDEHAEAKAGR